MTEKHCWFCTNEAEYLGRGSLTKVVEHLHGGGTATRYVHAHCLVTAGFKCQQYDKLRDVLKWMIKDDGPIGAEK